MKEKVLNLYDGKHYKFSTYFIINSCKLFNTDNFNFEKNLKNCFYVKKLGSNSRPKIYLDIKQNNKWVIKNQFIGDYKAFIEFISQNKNSFICIRGFSRANMHHLIQMVNELKGTNIKVVRFKNKIEGIQYERHLATKEQRIEELNAKLENRSNIEDAEKYIIISNAVFGKDRHESREKIIQLKRK